MPRAGPVALYRALLAMALPFALLASMAVSAASASVAVPVARIKESINEQQRVELKGLVPRAIARSVDLGPADPTLSAERMVMVLGSSPEQDAALAQFLRYVQTRGRPEYHQWLTPETFGQRFGAASADVAAIRKWLQSKGFRLETQSAGRRSIAFSGTIGQVNDVFAAGMHRYRWNGELHLANSKNPTIPKALSAVVRGFASLHDFRLQPQLVRGALRPQFDLSNGAHALAPGDFAIIYDLSNTYAAGTNGTGRTIAVIGRSDVQSVDINNFRSAFGLPASLPTVILAGSDPGLVTNDQTESDLDLEWAGGIAPNASLKFVTAGSTRTTDGVVLSAQYAVEQNVADVITVSYAGCESTSDVSGGTTFFNQLWQQAAAQGTSVFVSSGDSGAAGCDASNSTTATHGLGVNQLCSSPYSTCVGGTEFAADVSSPGTYWNPANTAGTNASALQYIGENVWNQSGTVSGGSQLWASGGGTSIYYAKPAWQLAAGVPSDGYRDVPDIAFNASGAHDPYLIYSSDGNSSSLLEGVGGTSASTPSMAGMAALVIQRQGGRVGSFNPVLYGLSGLQVNGGAAVFHTITNGNNSVPGQTGFSASTSDPIYNQVTGLGSIDGGVLVAHWLDFAGSSTGLAPTSVVVPATTTVSAATLTLPATTAWTASITGGSGWLALTPASGTGSAPLTFSTTANTAATSRTATITIDGQVLTVTQAAASGAAGQLTLSAPTLNFGTDVVGNTSAGQTVLVSNSGGTSITLGSISIAGADGADYADTGTCSAGLVLAPGASCFLRVTFDPTATGGRPATLQIGSASLPLSGTGEPASGSAPLPPWSYVMMAALLLTIGALRQRSAADRRNAGCG
jgi:subtilase family serine protease